MIKCNTCMQPLDVTDIEDHIKKYHFAGAEQELVSEKKVSYYFDESSTVLRHVSNSFNKKSESFREKILVLTGILPLKELYEKVFRNHPSLKKQFEIKCAENLVCNTCNKEIGSEISRIIITENKDKCPQFFSYHFFAPCWNLEDFTQRHSHLTLDKAIFSIPDNLPISEKSVKDLQTNLSFWD